MAPLLTPFVSIREFGAVPDDPDPSVRKKNSEAFVEAQAKMPSIDAPESWTLGHPLFIPPGQFYGCVPPFTHSALGLDHGVGHPLLLLCHAKAPNYLKKKGFKNLPDYSKWPKVADVVIEAAL